jgi:2-polyprenyl-3-methyl-5-hydroxy-6-metoxy-1,4-benzoquinol methylase
MPLFSSYLHRRRTNIVKPYLKGNILDIGCGRANLIHFLDENQHYIGIDLNKKLLIQLKEGYPKYKFYERDAENGINLDGKFDTITMIALIEHIKNPANMLRQSHDLLADDGDLVITTPTPLGDKLHKIGAKFGLTSKSAVEAHVKIYTHEDLQSLLNSFGLNIYIYQKFEFVMNQMCVARKNV